MEAFIGDYVAMIACVLPHIIFEALGYIAATLAGAGLPDGFHLAAAEVYSRMADFKDAPETPELAAVLQALLESD